MLEIHHSGQEPSISCEQLFIQNKMASSSIKQCIWWWLIVILQSYIRCNDWKQEKKHLTLDKSHRTEIIIANSMNTKPRYIVPSSKQNYTSWNTPLKTTFIPTAPSPPNPNKIDLHTLTQRTIHKHTSALDRRLSWPAMNSGTTLSLNRHDWADAGITQERLKIFGSPQLSPSSPPQSCLKR